MGLETEYGLHFSTTDSVPERDVEWFTRLITKISGDVPTVRSIDDPQKFFLANGGCVSLEPTPTGEFGQGLLESATPECCSPREIVACQSALDHLLNRNLKFLFPHTETYLVKNSSDADGHLFGQQENYTVEIASGFSLLFWRLGLILLLPLILIYKLTSVIFLGVILVLSCLVRQLSVRKPEEIVREMEVMQEPAVQRSNKAVMDIGLSESFMLTPWFVQVGASGLRMLHMPLAIAFLCLVRSTTMIGLRRKLLPFLASRVIWDGGGYLDRRGRFWLSNRVPAVTCAIGFGKYWGERPVIAIGHWLSAICADRWYSLAGWARLFRRRQRIQIQLGDATPSMHVEFLRLGTTALILDLIENNRDCQLPGLRRSMDAMLRYSSDWLMISRAADRKGLARSAIELQREYAKAVREMLESASYVPREAWEILQLWQSTLEQLEESRHDIDSQRWLLGRVDWVSKKWLLDQVPVSASWATRKKIDIRYHELSREGYQTRLVEALEIKPIVSDSQLERAMRLPPNDSPATKRGYLIREFASDDDSLRVNWNRAELIMGHKRKIVRF